VKRFVFVNGGENIFLKVIFILVSELVKIGGGKLKINKLKLRGFIGIKKGMDLDEIDLDFSNISGLVALDGPNGHGKTTVLDNMHPYACLASRKGALNHHTFLRDSFRDLEVEYQGDTYRFLIKIDCDSTRSEGFIYKNGATKSETNGKISEYKKYVEGLFGSRTLFFNSVFCAQNSEKLNDMTTGDLKALFSEFLRLDKLIEYENTSKQAANLIGTHVDKIDLGIEHLDAELVVLKGTPGKIDQVKRELTGIEYDKGGIIKDLEHSEKELSEVKQVIASKEVIKQRIDDLTGQRDSISDDLELDREDIGHKLNGKRAKATELGASIRQYKEILANADAIRAAIDKKKKLVGKRQNTENELVGSRKVVDELRNERNAAGAIKTGLDSKLFGMQHDLELPKLKNKIDGCRSKMADLERRDPECKSVTCSFIVGALDAKALLPVTLGEYDKKKEALNIEIQAIEKRITEADLIEKITCDAMLAGERQVKETANGLKRIDEDLDAVDTLACKISSLEIAESKVEDIGKRRTELINEGVKIKAGFEIREQEQMEHIDKIAIKIADQKKLIGDDLAQKVYALETDIQKYQRSIKNYNVKIDDLKFQLAKLEAEAKLYEDNLIKLKAMTVEKKRLTTEQTEWRYLQFACGKDGLRALEIDSVAPVMTGYANRLLHGAFGPNYSIKFLTQDENGKEILDIIALRDDGTQTLIDNLSGGERVWSLKALRLAMTLISKDRSGSRVDSVLADEEDGALDAENAQSFIRLYREFMDVGEFETCFYITHKPECVAMADHVMKFSKSGVTIV